MTVFYPDYSSYQGQATVASNVTAVVAKATEGNYYIDPDYQWYKDQAAHLGVPFSGYHFLKSDIDPATQARYYFSVAGNTPCMLDVETEGTSKPTVDQCLAFEQALEGLGGHVWGVYFPRWYWGEVGGDLSRLKAAVVASEYRSFDDNNWPAPYGGVTPPIWQYTSTPIDMNAFNGTAAELAALINGDTVTPDDIRAIAKAVYEYSEESVNINGKPYQASLGQLAHGGWVATNDPNGLVLKALAQLQASVAALSNSGGSGASPQAVAAETLAELKAKL